MGVRAPVKQSHYTDNQSTTLTPLLPIARSPLQVRTPETPGLDEGPLDETVGVGGEGVFTFVFRDSQLLGMTETGMRKRRKGRSSEEEEDEEEEDEKEEE